MYYNFECEIRAVFQSASTRYSLWYDGKCSRYNHRPRVEGYKINAVNVLGEEYDTVTCEYV